MDRNKSIDIFRAVAAFFIITVHVTFAGTTVFVPVARYAVPFFFILSGYFVFSKDVLSALYKQIKKMFVLVLLSNFLYGLFFLAISFLKTKDIVQILSSLISLETILKFIFLNEPLFFGHLWYLSAFLYCLIFAVIIHKKNLYKLTRSCL